MTAYYNEWDKGAAAWLRELIKMGLIADGVVDERSITDVQANDIRGFTQCHFFSGLGGWSYALRLSGWADDRPVWTASLPCQPFSVAGNQKGKEDERHLLPHFLELVRQCKPNRIFGEQVEGAVKHGWLDDLHTTMEAENYAVGVAVLGAHSVNAPHQRQRLYWVAQSRLSNAENWHGRRESQRPASVSGESRHEPRGNGSCDGIGGVADTINTRPQGRLSGRQDSQRETINRHAGRSSANDDGMGDTELHGPVTSTKQGSDGTPVFSSEKWQNCTSKLTRTGPSRALSSNWSDVEWLYCRDNKYRPILTGLKPVLRTTKPCTKPLADGLPAGMVHSGDTSQPINANETQEARVMRLRGYGNAIVPTVAAEFIKAFMSI